MSLGHGASIVRSGLVLHLDAANRKSYTGSGTAWNDLSNGRYNSTLNNTPIYSSANAGIIRFDGIDDYAIISNIPAATGVNYTASIWIRLDSSMSGVDGRFFWHGNYGVLIYRGSDNYFYFYTLTTNGAVNVQFGNTLPLNSWLNITGTYDGSFVRVYANGQFVTQLPQTGSLQAANLPNRFLLGSSIGSFPTKCDISQVLIYNTALTSNQIQQNFEATRGRYSI